MNVVYGRHDEDWESYLNDSERRKIAESWLNQSTLDAWRHERMFRPIRALIESAPDATWLTVGDGRFGTDAQALMRMGAKSVHASDISDRLLRLGADRGLIQTFSEENAEALSFGDGSFDYVLCKEAFHHFPRPYIALHEMMRVCRKGVVLIEPRDHNVDRPLLGWILSVLRLILGQSNSRHQFEPVGNYIYSISEREMEKFMLGMHLRHIAFAALNDAFIPGVEAVPIDPKTGADRKITAKIRGKIFALDTLSRFQVRNSGLLIAFLFKAGPNAAVQSALKDHGARFRVLPKNPYL